MCEDIPMKFFHCVGEPQAWRIIIAYALVTIAYIPISIFRLIPAAQQANNYRSMIAWWSVALLFPFCAIAGYSTTILAGWYPEIAYPIKEITGYLLVIVSFSFLFTTNKQSLKIVSEDDLKRDLRDLLSSVPTADLIAKITERIQ